MNELEAGLFQLGGGCMLKLNTITYSWQRFSARDNSEVVKISRRDALGDFHDAARGDSGSA